MDRAALLRFMRQYKYGVVSTVTLNGAPEAALVGVAVTDGFEIVFDTIETSRKVQNLRVNHRAALVIGDVHGRDERTAQVEGIADEPRGGELDRLKDAYFEVFPYGRDRQRWPGLTYVRVTPVWIRYSDYHANPPQILEFDAGDLGL